MVFKYAFPKSAGSGLGLTTSDVKILAEGMLGYFQKIEMELLPVLVQMEYNGFRVDADKVERLIKTYDTRLLELEHQVHNEAGCKFNIASSRKLGEILFTTLALPHTGLLTANGNPSVSKKVLQELKGVHPIVELLLEYKELKVNRSSFLVPLLLSVNLNTSRVHTTINNFSVASGRIATSKPNLQGIPKRSKLAQDIRKCFITGGNGNKLLWGDQSQIELRVMAHFSGDTTMLEAYQEGKLCLHKHTASTIFNKPVDEITSEERDSAKTVNFGIIYGMSAKGLAERLKIEEWEAKFFIESYFNLYPYVREWSDIAKMESLCLGYATTLLGRKRRLDPNQSLGKLGRQAVNTPIQGTAAEIMKIGMVKIQKRFEEQGIKSMMLLQVHDELVFEVLPGEMATVREIVTYEMENAVKLNVPLVVEMNEGACWWKEK